MTMIERVAISLYANSGIVYTIYPDAEEDWKIAGRNDRIKFLKMAKEAIESLFSPTDEMCNAGTRELVLEWNLPADGRIAEAIWKTMIYEALKS